MTAQCDKCGKSGEVKTTYVDGIEVNWISCWCESPKPLEWALDWSGV